MAFRGPQKPPPPATKPCLRCRSALETRPVVADNLFVKTINLHLCPVCDVAGNVPPEALVRYEQAKAKLEADKEDA